MVFQDMGHLIEWDIRRASFRAAVADLGPIKSLLMRGACSIVKRVSIPSQSHTHSKWNRHFQYQYYSTSIDMQMQQQHQMSFLLILEVPQRTQLATSTMSIREKQFHCGSFWVTLQLFFLHNHQPTNMSLGRNLRPASSSDCSRQPNAELPLLRWRPVIKENNLLNNWLYGRKKVQKIKLGSSFHPILQSTGW